jgi:hypothetical protein
MVVTGQTSTTPIVKLPAHPLGRGRHRRAFRARSSDQDASKGSFVHIVTLPACR